MTKEEIFLSRFKINDQISRKEFDDFLGVSKPKINNFSSDDDFQKAEYEYAKDFMFKFKEFKKNLLRNHKRAIKTLFKGRGYQLLNPKEQSTYAKREYFKEIKKASLEASELLSNIDHTLFSNEEKEIAKNDKILVATVNAAMEAKKKEIEQLKILRSL